MVSRSSFVALPSSNLEFIQNKAGLESGALGAEDSLVSLNATWSLFSGNSAKGAGGALTLYNCTAEFLGNCTVLNSFSGSVGGGLSAYASFILVGRDANLSFRHNSAVGAGGGVSIQRCIVTCYGSVTFEGW
jgi:hypothetical protein